MAVVQEDEHAGRGDGGRPPRHEPTFREQPDSAPTNLLIMILMSLAMWAGIYFAVRYAIGAFL